MVSLAWHFRSHDRKCTHQSWSVCDTKKVPTKCATGHVPLATIFYSSKVLSVFFVFCVWSLGIGLPQQNLWEENEGIGWSCRYIFTGSFNLASTFSLDHSILPVHFHWDTNLAGKYSWPLWYFWQRASLLLSCGLHVKFSWAR